MPPKKGAHTQLGASFESRPSPQASAKSENGSNMSAAAAAVVCAERDDAEWYDCLVGKQSGIPCALVAHYESAIETSSKGVHAMYLEKSLTFFRAQGILGHITFFHYPSGGNFQNLI